MYIYMDHMWNHIINIKMLFICGYRGSFFTSVGLVVRVGHWRTEAQSHLFARRQVYQAWCKEPSNHPKSMTHSGESNGKSDSFRKSNLVNLVQSDLSFFGLIGFAAHAPGKSWHRGFKIGYRQTWSVGTANRHLGLSENGVYTPNDPFFFAKWWLGCHYPLFVGQIYDWCG